MKKLKRDIFFWIERLQITRKERIVISCLMFLVIMIFTISALITKKYNSSSDNYAAILKEFEEKSAAIEERKNLAVNDSLIENEEKGTNTITLKININTADINELQKLKGIGLTYAQRIVDYRQENGEFKNIEELLNIKGIGEKRLEDIKSFITLK
ncbi:MAG: helix-hairpin-helix domain-containing protein [Balneola sp.]